MSQPRVRDQGRLDHEAPRSPTRPRSAVGLAPTPVGVLAAARTAHAAAQRRERTLVVGGIVLLGVLLLGFWEYGAGLLVNPRYVSSPTAVAGALGELVVSGELWAHLGTTLAEAGGGYLLGVAAGLVLAYLATRSPVLEETLDPFLRAFYSIPKIALAPLFIMWFGLGLTPKVLLAALMVLFVVLVNTIAGIRGVEPGLVSMARLAGGNEWAIARKVVLPAAAPAIMASVRICFARAMVGAILGEFIAARQGLGLLVVRASRQFETATVFAGILVIALLVMAVNGVLRVAEARLAPWARGTVHG